MQCTITNQCYNHKFLNLQQLHKYYRFFDCYILLLASKLTQDEKES